MSSTKQLAETLAAFGWPPIMRTAIACRYTVRSRWTLMRAVQAGELKAAGRSKRSLTFRREDLDRWMLGPEEPATTASPVRNAAPAEALARLDAIRRGDVGKVG